MSIDYADVERQFLATLEADSGRSLDAWMAAIKGQGLSHRNDIIDWLRRQGFMFSKASWLERIYNNDGKPIYEGVAGPRPRVPRPPSKRPMPRIAPDGGATEAVAVAGAIAETTDAVVPPSTFSLPPAAADAAALDALLVRAKAYRPLAQHIVALVRKALPEVAVTARDGFVAFGNGVTDFAALAISPKELRLGVVAATAPGSPWEAARLGVRGGPAATHMVILTDARQVTPDLLAVICRAAEGR